MQDYMKKVAQKGTQQNSSPTQQEMTNGIPNSTLQDVFAGKKHATSEMMGHSRNLAPSIAAKMSQAFGMDLTGMQVYQSDAMAGSGMKGMAQGNKVVLSSDVDLNTTAGQAILGHEISHIHAQSQGIGLGNNGLYENAALEHQADTEGLLAAQGKSIYSDGAMDMGIGMSYGLGMQGVEGMTTLGGGMSAGAGAPMQASGWKPSWLGGKKDDADYDVVQMNKAAANVDTNYDKYFGVPYDLDDEDEEAMNAFGKKSDKAEQDLKKSSWSGYSGFLKKELNKDKKKKSK